MFKSLFTKEKKSRYAPVVDIANTGVGSSSINDWLADWGGGKTAGVVVNEMTAMQTSAVFACVSLIGGTIASCPLKIYERQNGGRVEVKTDIWWLLNERPAADYSAATFWESQVANKLLQGNSYCIIKRPSFRSPTISGFEWVHASRCYPQDGQLGREYVWTDLAGITHVSLASDVLHTPGVGFNGYKGMSVINHALRDAAGIALAANRFSSNYFANGARPTVVLKHQGNPTNEQKQQIIDSFMERYSGVDNMNRPMLLVGGADVEPFSVNPEDSQLLETRQFQRRDIASIFGVPAVLIGDDSTSNWGSGVEQLSIGFVKWTISRHTKKFEQEYNAKLWPNRTKYFCEFDLNALQRGDYKSRMEGYRIAAGRAGEPGWMTVNEIREFENMPPVDGGDQLNSGGTMPVDNAVSA